jgi:hypothetical protein
VSRTAWLAQGLKPTNFRSFRGVHPRRPFDRASNPVVRCQGLFAGALKTRSCRELVSAGWPHAGCAPVIGETQLSAKRRECHLASQIGEERKEEQD